MRYFEYVYLVVAVGLLFFLATEYKHLQTTNIIAIFVGMGISSFMFSFRRSQRIKFEQLEKEELEELKREAGEDDN